MLVYEAPQSTSKLTDIRIFLAGSIEMGKAIDWQANTISAIQERAKIAGLDWNITIFNPRRKDWDSSWEQKFENPQFFQQVTWELDNIEKANCILFFIQAGTQSPITLLELGLIVKSGKKVVIVCEEGFWRKGNVDIICNRYAIRQENNIKDAIEYIIKHPL